MIRYWLWGVATLWFSSLESTNKVPPGVRIKDAMKVGKELATLFHSRFLQAFEFQMDVINNLSRSVFVIDNPDSGFAHKVTEAADMLTKELEEIPKAAN